MPGSDVQDMNLEKKRNSCYDNAGSHGEINIRGGKPRMDYDDPKVSIATLKQSFGEFMSELEKATDSINPEILGNARDAMYEIDRLMRGKRDLLRSSMRASVASLARSSVSALFSLAVPSSGRLFFYASMNYTKRI